MVKKPITISLILPVTVAGILVLAILSTISSTNQAFAQKRTELTIDVSYLPDKQAGRNDCGLLGCYMATGKLTSEGKGVGGARITIDWYPGKSEVLSSSPRTNSDGTYITVAGPPPHYPPFESVRADYPGDSEHMPAQSTFTLKRG